MVISHSVRESAPRASVRLRFFRVVLLGELGSLFGQCTEDGKDVHVGWLAVPSTLRLSVVATNVPSTPAEARTIRHQRASGKLS